MKSELTFSRIKNHSFFHLFQYTQKSHLVFGFGYLIMKATHSTKDNFLKAAHVEILFYAKVCHITMLVDIVSESLV